MTAYAGQGPRTVGEILKGVGPAKARRTFQPVRRNSYNVGERERRWWRPISAHEIPAIMRAAELHNLAHKRPGARNGPFGHVGLEILRLLFRTVDYRSGRLEPSIDYMMRMLRRSRDAVVRALAALKCEGFLDWIRRTEPIEDVEGPGPRIRQISNAYRFELPPAAAKLVARLLDRRRHDRGEARPGAAPPNVRPADPDLAAALARLGALIDREDASPPSGQNPA